MNRKTWDQLISGAGLVIAIVLVVLGGLAVHGGNFGRNSVQDRLVPEKVTFAPYDNMSPKEQATLGQYAGQQVTTGPQAEAFARYIKSRRGSCWESSRCSDPSTRGGAVVARRSTPW